jgi:hypothetical protein
MLHVNLRPRKSFKEVKHQLPNPLAIGVTLGGLLLDVIAPRPKPRAGFASAESSLLSARLDSRTPRRPHLEQHDGAPVASATFRQEEIRAR